MLRMLEGAGSHFFVSYTASDRDWAIWIAWELEQAGHQTTIQAWDFRPGQNFALAMQQATIRADCTIAVISPEFLQSEFARAEHLHRPGRSRRGRGTRGPAQRRTTRTRQADDSTRLSWNTLACVSRTN